MWALVRRPDGIEEEIEIPEDSYVETGDILDDGSVILRLKYENEDDFDAISMGFFADESDDESL
ncbi:MAG: hypothetical protein PHV39_09445 [Methanomicrobium sp.]|nr:hypothetical protein [Methanomicrobium sp.]